MGYDFKPRGELAPHSTAMALRALINAFGDREVARELNINSATLVRLVARLPTNPCVLFAVQAKLPELVARTRAQA